MGPTVHAGLEAGGEVAAVAAVGHVGVDARGHPAELHGLRLEVGGVEELDVGPSRGDGELGAVGSILRKPRPEVVEDADLGEAVGSTDGHDRRPGAPVVSAEEDVPGGRVDQDITGLEVDGRGAHERPAALHDGVQVAASVGVGVETDTLDGQEGGEGRIGGVEGDGAGAAGLDGRPRPGVVGLVGAADGEDGGSRHGGHDHDGDGGVDDAFAAPGLGGSTGGAALVGFVLLGGVEEGVLDGAEIRLVVGAPVECLGEADPAVQLAGWTAEAVPGVGGADEVTQDALAVDVVVEPAAQPRPGPGQRFVGQLDGGLVGGDQPGGHQSFDELFVVAVDGHQPARHPGAHRLPVGGDRHQSQQQRAQQAALLGGQRLVQRFGGVGDGAADPAGLPVALNGEGATFRRSQVWRKACDSSGSAPGSPCTSWTRTWTRPGSTTSPALRAGPSIAARS